MKELISDISWRKRFYTRRAKGMRWKRGRREGKTLERRESERERDRRR